MSHRAAGQCDGPLPSVEDEARGFRRLEERVLRTAVRQTFASARLRLSLLLGLSALLWAGLFAVVREGFTFLRTTIAHPMYGQVVHALFSTFFLWLLLMLLFSSSLILYGSLFRAREIAMLLTLPVRAERIFLHKFRQAVVLSSWGFLLLGSPMLLAYGIVAGAPWYYYAALVPLMSAFVVIPVAAGAVLCLELMYRAPTLRRLLVVLAAAGLVAAMTWFVGGLLTRPESDLLTTRWFRDMLGRLELTEQRLLPSWWLSSALREMSEDTWSEGVLFLTLLIANALFCREVAIWLAARLYRRAYSRAWSTGGGPRRKWFAWLDAALAGPLALLSRPVRLMLVKDLRLFRRDPTQWSQFLILFALLGLYSINVHPFQAAINYARWVSMVSFMNLCVVGLLMATFTTRFIFPMISLEGRRLWFLGMLPLRRDTVLWSKFLFSVGSLWLPCGLLILASDWTLRVSPWIHGNHQLACGILVLGLSGIAVGLGARLPNLREPSPARIAAGFGGTLNLVLGTLYILAVAALMALPCHFQSVAPTAGSAALPGNPSPLDPWLRFWLVGGTLASLLLGAVATAVPLRMGFRAFRRLEY
jgi:ABC-2 type transport system permease protein